MLALRTAEGTDGLVVQMQREMIAIFCMFGRKYACCLCNVGASFSKHATRDDDPRTKALYFLSQGDLFSCRKAVGLFVVWCRDENRGAGG